MPRSRKRPETRARERAERRERCEFFRGVKVDRAELLAEYEHLVQAGACCPICGRPLVDPTKLLSVSVPTLQGICHEACA